MFGFEEVAGSRRNMKRLDLGSKAGGLGPFIAKVFMIFFILVVLLKVDCHVCFSHPFTECIKVLLASASFMILVFYPKIMAN